MSTDDSDISGSGYCLYDLFCSETPSLESQRDRWLSSGPNKRLENLLSQAGNKFCADCGSPGPKWVSSNIGVYICIKCSGVHRSLGVHISKVLSAKLDQWTDEQVDNMVKLGGNTVLNKKYEACIPSNVKKPKPNSSIEERTEFIRRKYETLQFLDCPENLLCPFPASEGKNLSSCQSSSSSNNPPPEKKHCEKQQQVKNRIGQALRNSWGRKDSSDHHHHHKITKKSNSMAGMVEFVGLIKVNVVKGTNLAVRDVMTSDPYVILSLGNQSVKTRVIKNNLNPIWNESLMLSIPEDIPLLKVLVYDKDKFSTDDFMGEAEIDIQPLVAAAKAFEKSSTNETIELGDWVASNDSNFCKDGVISTEGGRIKQDISVRLQKVEKGVLEFQLECLTLTQ